jgi:GH24 family phage-related lysozyme (muramidase)
MGDKAQLAVKIAAPLVLSGAAILGAMQQWEKQVLYVYADNLAGGLPTFCSGSTSWSERIGRRFTKDECDAIDFGVATDYGRAILSCIPSDKLDQNSFDAMTLFAINVGKVGACNSRAAQLLRAGAREEGCRAISFGPNGQHVWSFASGKYLIGLHRRRVYESNWCAKEALSDTGESNEQ